MQRRLVSVWHRALTWQLKLSVSKFKVLEIGHETISCEYKLIDFCLPVLDHNKDMGVNIDNHLTFKLHVTSIVLRAEQRAATILRWFYTRYANILSKAFTVYVRPLLEYCCSVWSPYLAGIIDNIEGVQRTFNKKIRDAGHLWNIDRLKNAKIERLEFRKTTADFSLYLKKFPDLIDIDTQKKHFVVF